MEQRLDADREGLRRPTSLGTCHSWAARGQGCELVLCGEAYQGTDLGYDLPSLLCPQSPAVIDSPLKLELQAMVPPRCTIKPSGTTISVTASVTIALVPPNQAEVQLSSMIMVGAPEPGLQEVWGQWAVNPSGL